MSIKVYQSKQGKKLYEVYVGVKARGKIYKKEGERIFKGILFPPFQQPRELSLS